MVFQFGFALVGLQPLSIPPLLGGVDVGVLGQVLSQSCGWSRYFFTRHTYEVAKDCAAIVLFLEAWRACWTLS